MHGTMNIKRVINFVLNNISKVCSYSSETTSQPQYKDQPSNRVYGNTGQSFFTGHRRTHSDVWGLQGACASCKCVRFRTAACTSDIRFRSSFFFGRRWHLSAAESTVNSTIMRKWKLMFVGGWEYKRPIS